jgi:ABC-type bacteriocin/lantibiotic exporter with double-glycine peptidase domain
MARKLTALAVAILLATLAGLPAGARDRPRPKRETGTFVGVPVGAIKVPLRDVQQDDEFSCGAAVTMAVCHYYGVGPRDLAGFKKLVRTTTDGTYYGSIRDAAEKLGLAAKVRTDMTPDNLIDYLKDGIPVICSIQAWGEKGADYSRNDNGHYVVAIGYDDQRFYFMDPSANWEEARADPRYAYLTRAELEKRWHEQESKWEFYKGLGIIIHPKAAPRLRARMIE